MFRKLLAPLDGSMLAERALEPAVALAKGSRAELILLYVAGLKDILVRTNDAYGFLLPEQSLARCRQEAEAYLSAVVQDVIPATIAARPMVMEGDVAESLIDVATVEGVDLIVISTHGRSGPARWITGSVAEKVLRGAPCPVLIVREPKSISRILITLDGSTLAEHALAPGIAAANALNAKVYLLRVDDVAVEADAQFITELEEAEPGLGERYRVDYYHRPETYLEGVANRFREWRVEIKTHVYTGKAAHSILNFVEREEIDLIVMATHGRSGLRRLVYGSVTERVLRGTRGMIMIVRPPSARLN